MGLYEDVDDLWTQNQPAIDNMMKGWIEQARKERAIADRKTFHQWEPLRIYTSFTRMRSGEFSVRFHGQEVATIKVLKNDNPYLYVDEKTNAANREYFKNGYNFPFNPDGYPWTGKDAKEFRMFFKQLKLDTFKVKTPEHEVETNIIKEMSRKTSKKFGGNLIGIQPVVLGGMPCQFPLPISGSSGYPKFSRGNIDILARRRGNDGKVRLSIWELKKPGTLAHVEKQVYIYSLVLQRMLRSSCGADWYKTFRFSRALPKSLEFESVIVVSPKSKKQELLLEQRIRELKHNERMTIESDGSDFRDTIGLHVLYYDGKTHEIGQLKKI